VLLGGSAVGLSALSGICLGYGYGGGVLGPDGRYIFEIPNLGYERKEHFPCPSCIEVVVGLLPEIFFPIVGSSVEEVFGSCFFFLVSLVVVLCRFQVSC
jgi:hypothetical protein